MGVGLEPWRSHLLDMFTGQADGLPDWVRDIDQGEDAGYFGAGSAAWAVHGNMATIVAGIRALLMQALHPGAMAGVHDWSRYREDPLGRLSGTIRWVVVVTFASSASARAESARVGRFHERVRGTYPGPDGAEVPYSAGDPELLSWVHMAFADAFLGSHERWGRAIPGGPDGYVSEWAAAGEMVGVQDPPRSAGELRARIEELRTNGTLRRDARVDEVVGFIRKPPLRRAMRPAYRVLFGGAVASLPREYRRLLGLRRSWLPVVTGTRFLLWGVARVLGQRSTAEDSALRRIARLAEAGLPTEPVVWQGAGGRPTR
jgi:uncharacterized protein (DUF2236 family)